MTKISDQIFKTQAKFRMRHLSVVLFFMIWAFDIYCAHNLLAWHAPLSDDISMIAYSRSWSWDWLTKGLADYFTVYPEYYAPQSNFIRPVSNFAYWLFAKAIPFDSPFLSNKIQLIFLNYGTHAAICSIITILIRKATSSWIITCLGFLACIAMPPFWTTPATTYSSFVFDELAVLFCILGLVAIGRHRLGIMTTCLALALLTKEIAIPFVAAVGLAFVMERQWRAFTGVIFAIVLWVFLRINGFGLHAEGVYVFSNKDGSVSDVLLEKLRNALTLPLGPVFFDGVNFQNFGRSSILLVLNAIVFAAVIYVGLQSYRLGKWPSLKKNILSKGITDHNQTTLNIVCFTTAFSFLFDAYVGANYRYALNLLPFLYIAISGISFAPFVRGLLFFVFATGSIISSAPYIARLQSNFEFETYRYQVVRSLFSELRAHADSRSIVVLNDFVTGFANPAALQILVPTTTTIIRGTSLYLDGCSLQELKKIETTTANGPDSIRTKTILPDCGHFTFESSPNLGKFIVGNKILRNDIIHYEFDRASLNLAWSWHELSAFVNGSDIVYFDFGNERWIFIKSPD